MSLEQVETTRKLTFPKWLLAVFPLLLLVGMVILFIATNPLTFFTGAFPPLEELAIQRVLFPDSNLIEVSVVNGSPDTVHIAQVLVDDAYWQYEISPGSSLERLEEATIRLTYPWVDGEPLPITLLTSTGASFTHEVEVAVQSPENSGSSIIAYGLLGIYVGVIPVMLGMLWYPFMRRVDRRWLSAILALTVGLLLFLFVDTVLEALEMAAELPGAFQGEALVVFGTLLSLGILMAVGQRRGDRSPRAVATLIALGIGLHNLGEGLAIGAAFASGAAALGSFLVIGFTLHNITEGVGIAAPLVRGTTPRLRTFIGLALLAGAPAMLGTWIGGYAFSPLLAVLFLSIGAGAILQVIWEVGKLLLKDAQRHGQPAVSWLNFAGVTAGILVMYLTAFLVKF